MLLISDILLFNSLKEAELFIHDKVKYQVFKSIVRYSFSNETNKSNEIPVVYSSLVIPNINHVRLNIKNRNFNTLIVINDIKNSDWYLDFYKQGFSLLVIHTANKNIISEIQNDMDEYVKKYNESITDLTDYLQDYNKENIQYDEILCTLKKHSDYNSILLKSNNEIVASSFTKKTTVLNLSVNNALFKIKKTITIFKCNIINHENKVIPCIWIKIPSIDQDFMQLIIFNNENYLYKDFLLYETISNSIRFERLKEIATTNSQIKQLNEIFDSLLNGKHSSMEEMINNANKLGYEENKKYRTITLGFFSKSTTALISDKGIIHSIFQYLIPELQTIWPKLFFRQYPSRITFIVEENDKINIKDKLKLLINNTNKTLDNHNITLKIGVSDKSEIQELHKNSGQALKVIKIAQLLSSPESIIFYADLGIYRLLINLQDQDSIDDAIPEILLEIEEYNPEYLLTLFVFLEENQNYSLSSKRLFVHPKTVKYRIGKLVELFNINLHIPEQVLNLQVGYLALKLKNNKISF